MDIEKSEFEITDKMRQFVDEYLIDMNGTQAAIRAGYSEATAQEQSSQLLDRPDIRELVEQRQKDRIDRTQISQDLTVNELKAIALSDIADFVIVKEGGVIEQRPFNELKKEQTRCVKKIRQTVRTAQSSDGTVIHQTAVLELELYDKVKSLELLGRHLGIFNDRLTLDGALPLMISFEVAPPVADIIITRGQGREQKKLQA
jgi:phage terminase small subunit